jgi:hypothetical protein
MSLSASEITALLEKDEAAKSTVSQRREFYAGFDQAALFLLDWEMTNLFEPAGKGDWYFTCKGCRQVVERNQRKNHHSNHKREYAKIRES